MHRYMENSHVCQCGNHHCSGTCDCGCDQSSHYERRYFSKSERIASLERYLESLRLETTAVEERVAALRQE